MLCSSWKKLSLIQFKPEMLGNLSKVTQLTIRTDLPVQHYVIPPGTHVSQTHNWTSCRARENCVPPWRLMQQTIWTLKLLHNRPNVNKRKFNNNTKNITFTTDHHMFCRSLTAAFPTPTQAPTEIFLMKTVLFLSDSNDWCLFKKKKEINREAALFEINQPY